MSDCAYCVCSFEIVMPESMSIERRKLMSAYGATFELTPKEKGMKGAIEKAQVRLSLCSMFEV